MPEDFESEFRKQITSSNYLDALGSEHVRQVRGRLSAYRKRGFDQPGRLGVSDREHATIVKAICAGLDSQAADAMRTHITVGGEAMMALVLAAEADARSNL